MSEAVEPRLTAYRLVVEVDGADAEERIFYTADAATALRHAQRWAMRRWPDAEVLIHLRGEATP